MPSFQHVQIPEGDLIQTKDGKPVVGSRPIVGLLPGDGIGTDITPAMTAVVEAAVHKSYGEERSIAWCPLYAGLQALPRYGVGQELPEETIEAIRHLGVAIKGHFTTPIGDEKFVCLHCAHQQDDGATCGDCGKNDGLTPRYRSINVRLRQTLDLYA